MCWVYVGWEESCFVLLRNDLCSPSWMWQKKLIFVRFWDPFAALYEADHTEERQEKQNESRALTFSLYP